MQSDSCLGRPTTSLLLHLSTVQVLRVLGRSNYRSLNMREVNEFLYKLHKDIYKRLKDTSVIILNAYT